MSSNFSYEYDEGLAQRADEAANRITEGGAYVGKFKKAWAIKSDNTGTEGISFVFESPGNGDVEFSIYTRKADGTAIFGAGFINAMMYLMGIKSLVGQAGKIERYNRDEKKREEVDGHVYPELCEKHIGVVFQKELYSKEGGGSGDRLNLYGLYQPETKLMMTELKERKTTPVKLDRLLKALKVKDSRKSSGAEPSQPSMAGIDGGGF